MSGQVNVRGQVTLNMVTCLILLVAAVEVARSTQSWLVIALIALAIGALAGATYRCLRA